MKVCASVFFVILILATYGKDKMESRGEKFKEDKAVQGKLDESVQVLFAGKHSQVSGIVKEIAKSAEKVINIPMTPDEWASKGAELSEGGLIAGTSTSANYGGVKKSFELDLDKTPFIGVNVPEVDGAWYLMISDSKNLKKGQPPLSV